jgi:sulfur carrier protein
VHAVGADVQAKAFGVIVVTLNGESRELPDGATVELAVRAAGAPAGGRGVAVAVDGEVIPRGVWEATPVHAGQELEVLQAVQGGR